MAVGTAKQRGSVRPGFESRSVIFFCLRTLMIKLRIHQVLKMDLGFQLDQAIGASHRQLNKYFRCQWSKFFINNNYSSIDNTNTNTNSDCISKIILTKIRLSTSPVLEKVRLSQSRKLISNYKMELKF